MIKKVTVRTKMEEFGGRNFFIRSCTLIFKLRRFSPSTFLNWRLPPEKSSFFSRTFVLIHSNN